MYLDLFRATAITYAAPILDVPPVPRARGQLALVAKRRGEDSVVAKLRQQGSLKALFPKIRGQALQAVFLNTAGGLTGGDRMRLTVAAQRDAHVVVSSQAAERAYRAQPESVAQTEVTLSVAPGGRVDWLPQETILFDGAALQRRLRLDLAQNATALIVEPVVFGRAAMGETVRDLQFADQWRVFREDQLVFADAVRVSGDAQADLERKAIADGARAMATILLVGPTAASCAQIRMPSTAGASLIADDLLLIRMMAADSFALRQDLVPVIEAASGAAIPRVWRL